MQHPVWGAALVEGFVPEGRCSRSAITTSGGTGQGYPAKLAADDIPIEARIVGIADAFAAMREERPYRPRALAAGCGRRAPSRVQGRSSTRSSWSR